MPDVRLVLGHVHRQLDELPHRGARPRAARQRLDARHPRGAPRALLAGRADRRGPGPALVRATTTRRRSRARSPAGRRSRTRWRSTSRWAAPPTPCCTSSPRRRRARSTSTSPTSTRSPGGCRACPRSRPNSDYHMEDVHRAGGIPAILGELRRAGLLNADVHTVHSPSLDAVAGHWDVRRPRRRQRRWSSSTPRRAGCARPRRSRRRTGGRSLDTDAARRLHPGRRARVHDGRRARRAARQHRARRRGDQDGRASTRSCGISRARRGSSRARRRPSRRSSASRSQPGDVLVVRYEGPSGGPGMQEMLHPTSFLKGAGPGPGVRADHRRPVLRRLQSASRSGTSPPRPPRAG